MKGISISHTHKETETETDRERERDKYINISKKASGSSGFRIERMASLYAIFYALKLYLTTRGKKINLIDDLLYKFLFGFKRDLPCEFYISPTGIEV